MFKETPKKIISLQNPLVKHLVKLRVDGEYRKKEGRIFVSGTKLVNELPSPHQLYSVKPIQEPHVLVSEGVMKKITGLTNPEGIAAEFSLPEPSTLEGKAPILVLDQINDPGNMGTLIRTALALGWEGVFILPGSVDPFHEKVIRASRGALFRLPWREGSWEELKALKLKGYTADIEGVPLREIVKEKRIALVMSNEAQGVSKEGRAFGEGITIPMRGEMESLNVAVSGTIMMYVLGESL